MPRGVNGLSSCPISRRSRFHSVSPCRIAIKITLQLYLDGRGLFSCCAVTFLQRNPEFLSSSTSHAVNTKAGFFRRRRQFLFGKSDPDPCAGVFSRNMSALKLELKKAA